MDKKQELNTCYIEFKDSYDKEEQKKEKLKNKAELLIQVLNKNGEDIELLQKMNEKNSLRFLLNENKKRSELLAFGLLIFGLLMTIVDSNIPNFNIFRDLMITITSTGIVTSTVHITNKKRIVNEYDSKKQKYLNNKLNESFKIKNELEGYLNQINYEISNTNDNMCEIISSMEKIMTEIRVIENFENTYNVSPDVIFQKKKGK